MIEHVAAENVKAKEKNAGGGASAGEVAETCISVKRQLEAMQAENGLLLKAVEDGVRGEAQAVRGARAGGARGARRRRARYYFGDSTVPVNSTP